jgi:hypothetical protein
MTSKSHTENFQSLETFIIIRAKNGLMGQSFLGLAKTGGELDKFQNGIYSNTMLSCV